MIEKLTQSRVNSFSIPDKRTDVRDELVTGLVLRLEVSGRKSWYVVYCETRRDRATGAEV